MVGDRQNGPPSAMRIVRCIQRSDQLGTDYMIFFHNFPRSLIFFSLGSDPLVRRLYEFEEQIEDPSLNLNPTTRSLWKYRRQVTVEHLGNAFQQADESFDKSQHKIPRAFLKQVTAVAGLGSVFSPFYFPMLSTLQRIRNIFLDTFYVSHSLDFIPSPNPSPLFTVGVEIDPIGVDPLT